MDEKRAEPFDSFKRLNCEILSKVLGLLRFGSLERVLAIRCPWRFANLYAVPRLKGSHWINLHTSNLYNQHFANVSDVRTSRV